VIETDPRFASQAGFLGSDYLMDRLGFNGQSTMKRLGDGFYEQRMVLDQITSLTGRRYPRSFRPAVRPPRRCRLARRRIQRG